MKLPAVVSIALVATLLACGGDDKAPEGPPPEVNAVKIEGIDYGYTVSGSVKSGLTKITFANAGKDFHMMEVTKLKDGKGAPDALAALASDDEADDEATFVDTDAVIDGKPSILTPGSSTTTYARLEPGSYALICFFPTPDLKSLHYSQGMLNVLTVTVDATTMPEPATRGEVTTDDKKLTIPDLSTGKGTYRYTNTGSNPHALLFVRLHDGKRYEDFLAWADAYFAGKSKLETRPADTWGGIEKTKTAAFFELDLPPGRYLVLDTASPPDKEQTANGEYFRDAQGGLRAEFTVA